MITFTPSITAALALPNARPRTLVEMDTPAGTWRFARELLVWGGYTWSARLMEDPDLSMDLAGADAGISTARTLQITLANADGWVSRQGPNFFRGRQIRVFEVLMDVDNVPMQSFAFTCTGFQADALTARVTAEDTWGGLRRQLLPVNDLLLQTSDFPVLPQQNIGASVPILFGRSLVPLTLVDDVNSSVPFESRFIACQGSATWGGNTPTVVELFNGALTIVESFRTAYSVLNGRQITEVYIASPIRQGGTGAVTTKFADLQWDVGSDDALPDLVLLRMLQGREGMNSAIGVDSDSLLATRNFHLQNSITFSCVLTGQRFLEDWLGDWAHDSLVHINMRDKIYLVPQGSRTPVASFHAGNILRDTMSVTDVPLGAEESRQKIGFIDRTVFQPDVQGFVAGSGVETARASPFIGKDSVAQIVAQFWAKVGTAVRRYEFESTLRMGATEAGDLAVLTHSWAATNPQLVLIEQMGRQSGKAHFVARDWTYEMFQSSQYGIIDAPFRRSAQRFGIPDDLFPMSPGDTYAIDGSHQLYSTPFGVRAAYNAGEWARTARVDMTFANGSLYSIEFTSQGSTLDVKKEIAYYEILAP